MGYTSDGSQKNWLQQLIEKIPGISGYQAKETRRDVDKLYRENLANRLRATKNSLTSVVRDLTDGGRLMEVTPIERIAKKIDTVEGRVRHATYGYSGFFDAVQIKEQQLDALYQFDLKLVDKVEVVEGLSTGLRAASGTPTELKAAEGGLEQAVDDLNSTFDTRQQAINGFAEATAAGRPLFS